MLSDSPDDASVERELARAAYSRPVDGVDFAAAQAQLAALAEARRAQPELDWHTPAIPAPASRPTKLFIATAAAVALAIASVIAAAPTPSLAVFDRPQVGVPQWPDADAQDGEQIRWLASSRGWDVFGFLTPEGNVCLASFDGMATGGGACTSRVAFDVTGLSMGTSRSTGESTQFLSVKWGPDGDARISELPLADWAG